MKSFLVIAVFLLCSLLSFSQTPSDINKTSTQDDTIYTVVDSVATFPGGRPAWIKYIEKTLNPSVGVDNGAGRGTYTVIIKFTVEKDGTLKDFVPVTKYKHGFEEEVIRVLKLSPKWIPAKKNSVPVNSIVEQSQVFRIS